MIMLASDLDQTLIYTQRSADADLSGLLCVEHYQDKPLSFVTTAAADLIDQLGAGHLVPTTTRMLRQYRRIQLPIVPAYAIAANGGHLLVEGEIDEVWAKHIADLKAEDGTNPYAAAAAMSKALGSVATSIRYADDLFTFAVVDLTRLTPAMTDELSSWAEQVDWAYSLQGRKIYLVPRWLTKEYAVAEVARRQEADTVLAAGDSLLDIGMLTAADHAIRPAHGELHRANYQAEGLQVTTTSGVAAGEEILRWASGHINHG